MLPVDAIQVKIVQYKIGEKDFSDCDLGWRDYNPTNNLEEIIKYFCSKLDFFIKVLSAFIVMHTSNLRRVGILLLPLVGFSLLQANELKR